MIQVRTVVVAVAATIVVIVAAWFFLVFGPKGDEIAEVEEQLEQARTEEQNLRTTLERLRELDENRPALEAELRRLEAAVPPRPELASFILAAHEVAARADLEFVSITPAQPADIEGVDAAAIAMSIRAEGRFFSVLDYLDRMERLERLVVVDSLNLAAVEPAPEEEGATGSAAAAGGTRGDAGGADGATTREVSETVSISSELGAVTTDVASLGAERETARSHTETDGDSGSDGDTGSDRATAGERLQAALDRAQPQSVPDQIEIALDIQARAFTTQLPETPGNGGGTTPTTAPPEGAATTTTTEESG